MGERGPARAMRRLGAVMFGAALLMSAISVLAQAGGHSQAVTAARSDAPQRCVPAAAAFHGVNPFVLEAVLRVESGLKPDTVTRNSNGSVDVGMGGINSIHFQELARHGVMPQHLLDACVATYVAAWHLRRVQDRHGNTWEGIARYHSATPVYNWRYRVLLHNELVRMGVIRNAPVYPVPRLSAIRPQASSSALPVVPREGAGDGVQPTRQRAQANHPAHQVATAPQADTSIPTTQLAP